MPKCKLCGYAKKPEDQVRKEKILCTFRDELLDAGKKRKCKFFAPIPPKDKTYLIKEWVGKFKYILHQVSQKAVIDHNRNIAVPKLKKESMKEALETLDKIAKTGGANEVQKETGSN